MHQRNNTTRVFLKINKDIFMSEKDNTTTVFLKISKDIFMLSKIIPLQYFSK